MKLARHYQTLLDSGKFENRVALARQLDVSRARVAQVLSQAVGNPSSVSRVEAFRSGEVLPLAADWSLRDDKEGDVIDLWAQVKQMSLRQAAEDLVRTFDLEPAPRQGCVRCG
jgi:hypothetical protein